MAESQILVLEKTSSALSCPELEKTIAAFFSSFESELTGKEYFRASKEFFSIVGSDLLTISDLKRDHLIFYQRWLQNEGRSRKTILKKLSAVSSLCKHLAHEGYVERDLAYGLKRPKSTNRIETADLFMHFHKEKEFTWGGASLSSQSENRMRYIAALKKADNYEFDDLIAFATS